MLMYVDLPAPDLHDTENELIAFEVIKQMPIGYILGSIKAMADKGDSKALELLENIIYKKTNLTLIKEEFLTYIVSKLQEAESIVYPPVMSKC